MGAPETSSPHADAGGDACTFGDDGACSACGVARVECSSCTGVGYHRKGCVESDAEEGR